MSTKLWRTTDEQHVLFVSYHCCTRVQKQAQALKDAGWRVDSISVKPPVRRDVFRIGVVADVHKLERFIETNGAPIIHVHNEPDSLMRTAVKASRGRPVVYDCHDLEYYRYGRVTDDEAYAFKSASAVVHVSKEHRDAAFALHPWDYPEVLVMSCPPRSWITPIETERSGVVYEGGLVKPGSERFKWRDLLNVTEAFDTAGVTLDLYSAESMREFYPRCKGWLEYPRLLSAMHGYDFGLLGADPANEKWAVAVPNKMWDYAACGVIPAMLNAPAARDAFGPGAIYAESVGDLIDRIKSADVKKLRAKMRPRFMDGEVVGLVRLYESLV